MKALFYYGGEWLLEQPKIAGPMDHTFWMSSVVFDGARAFRGLMPDIDQHCRRLVASAHTMLLKPTLTAEQIEALCREGAARFPKEMELYVRPMFFAMRGFVSPEPDSTEFALAIYDMPMPAFKGFKACLSTRRRPAPDMAPTAAKASCLYPNSAIALKEANARGFDNAIVLDHQGHVAEYATANIWIARDGVAMTPAPNGCFLNGVTRQRVIALLREDGIDVRETTLGMDDVMAADEVFNTGNYGKVMPCIQVEDRRLAVGPIARRAFELYFDYAKRCPI